MDFIKLPPVAVSVQAPGVLDGGVNSIHVLKAPISSTYNLGKREILNLQGPLLRPPTARKKDGHQRKPNSFGILMVFQIRYSQMITTISLVKQAVNRPMVLARGRGLSLKVETDIKSGISCCLYQNQLSKS